MAVLHVFLHFLKDVKPEMKIEVNKTIPRFSKKQNKCLSWLYVLIFFNLRP